MAGQKRNIPQQINTKGFNQGKFTNIPQKLNDKPAQNPNIRQIGSEIIEDGLLQTLAIAKTQGLGLIFGVGIKAAELNQRVQNVLRQNNYEVPDGEPNFPVIPDALPNQAGGFNKTSGWDGYMSSSLTGMPVMCYIKFVGGQYTDLQGNLITIPDIIFETVIITLTMGKNIERTKISGRDDGDVFEYIGMGNWDVEIRAIVTADAPVNPTVQKRNQYGTYPRENIGQIWQILKAPIAIPVECWYLNQFDINYLVINNGVQIQQVEGEYNMQRIVIPCVSDKPLVITIAQ